MFRGVRRLPGHHARAAAAAHAAHVGHERDLRHLARRLARHRGRKSRTFSTVLGVTAVICATINVVGGFWITERMLKFFRRKRGAGELAARIERPAPCTASRRAFSYLFASVFFIVGLKSLSHPTPRAAECTSRKSACCSRSSARCCRPRSSLSTGFVGPFMIGGIIGDILAQRVPMTAMPQFIAFSHAFGAIAATLVGVVEYRVARRGHRRHERRSRPSASRCSSARSRP